MNGQQISLLLIQATMSLVVLVYLFVLLLKRREERDQFKLYAIRDKIIYLAATGELSQDGMIFKVFYSAVNASISEASKLTVASLIHASMKAKDAVEGAKRERLMEAIQRSSPGTREAVEEFVTTMMDIVYSNSLTLRAFVFCIRLVRGLATSLAGGLRTAVGMRRPQAYETYIYWRDLHDHVCPVV
jgi:hypothetical protein